MTNTTGVVCTTGTAICGINPTISIVLTGHVTMMTAITKEAANSGGQSGNKRSGHSQIALFPETAICGHQTASSNMLNVTQNSDHSGLNKATGLNRHHAAG